MLDALACLLCLKCFAGIYNWCKPRPGHVSLYISIYICIYVANSLYSKQRVRIQILSMLITKVKALLENLDLLSLIYMYLMTNKFITCFYACPPAAADNNNNYYFFDYFIRAYI